MNQKKGFTLIELLVVIAIIGILSAVVLASLNTARSKGADSAIKSTINNARAQGALYYDNHGQSYNGICAASDGLANAVAGVNTNGVVAVCNETASHDGFAFSSPLKYQSTLSYCVDSTGMATTSTAVATAGVCS